MSSTDRKVIGILGFFVVVFVMGRLSEYREAVAEQSERKEAAAAAEVIQNELGRFVERNGLFPADLRALNLGTGVIEKFRYSTNADGYALGYFGKDYSTAARRWNGEYPR